jgi:hypothetical protein
MAAIRLTGGLPAGRDVDLAHGDLHQHGVLLVPVHERLGDSLRLQPVQPRTHSAQDGLADTVGHRTHLQTDFTVAVLDDHHLVVEPGELEGVGEVLGRLTIDQRTALGHGEEEPASGLAHRLDVGHTDSDQHAVGLLGRTDESHVVLTNAPVVQGE